ncbi:hypothetical protein A2U01_0014130, partial [Trifolium medium]|nr:hypothetical protein [Trifolium medium]
MESHRGTIGIQCKSASPSLNRTTMDLIVAR